MSVGKPVWKIWRRKWSARNWSWTEVNWNKTLWKSQGVVLLNFLKLCPDFTYCQSYCHLSTHVRSTRNVLVEILFILCLYLWFIPNVWDCSWRKRTVISYKRVAKQVALKAKQLPSWGYLQLLCSFSKFLCHNDLIPLQMLFSITIRANEGSFFQSDPDRYSNTQESGRT